MTHHLNVKAVKFVNTVNGLKKKGEKNNAVQKMWFKKFEGP